MAYGEAVTPERLAMIDAAEQFLRAKGCAPCVRYHAGDVARLEVPAEVLSRVCELEFRTEPGGKAAGVGLQICDARPGRFRSGSLNALVPLENLTRTSI